MNSASLVKTAYKARIWYGQQFHPQHWYQLKENHLTLSLYNTSAISRAASCKRHLPSPSCSTRAIKESLSQNILDNFLEQKVRRGGYSPPPPPKKKKKTTRKGMGNQATALRLQTGGWHEWPDIASLLLGLGRQNSGSETKTERVDIL